MLSDVLFRKKTLSIAYVSVFPINQLSAVENEFSSERLRVFDQKYTAGRKKQLPTNVNWKNRITYPAYAMESVFLPE